MSLSGTGNLFVAGGYLRGGGGGAGDGFQGWDGVCGRGINSSSTATYAIQILDSNLSPSSTQCTTDIYVAPGSSFSGMAGSATLLKGPTLLRDTDTMDLTVTAAVGARIGITFSTGHANHFAGLGGPFLVQVPGGPFYQSMLYLGSVGPTGAVRTSIGMRDIPLLTHTRLHIMAVSISPQGRRYSNPVTPLLLDAAW